MPSAQKNSSQKGVSPENASLFVPRQPIPEIFIDPSIQVKTFFPNVLQWPLSECFAPPDTRLCGETSVDPGSRYIDQTFPYKGSPAKRFKHIVNGWKRCSSVFNNETTFEEFSAQSPSARLLSCLGVGPAPVGVPEQSNTATNNSGSKKTNQQPKKSVSANVKQNQGLKENAEKPQQEEASVVLCRKWRRNPGGLESGTAGTGKKNASVDNKGSNQFAFNGGEVGYSKYVEEKLLSSLDIDSLLADIEDKPNIIKNAKKGLAVVTLSAFATRHVILKDDEDISEGLSRSQLGFRRWLSGIFKLIAQHAPLIPKGAFLWELVHPQTESGLPMYNPHGFYAVRLFLGGIQRTVEVDDLIPCSESGAPLFPCSMRKHEIWPWILSKAIWKAFQATFGDGNPVTIIEALTGLRQVCLPLTRRLINDLCDRGLWATALLQVDEKYNENESKAELLPNFLHPYPIVDIQDNIIVFGEGGIPVSRMMIRGSQKENKSVNNVVKLNLINYSGISNRAENTESDLSSCSECEVVDEIAGSLPLNSLKHPFNKEARINEKSLLKKLKSQAKQRDSKGCFIMTRPYARLLPLLYGFETPNPVFSPAEELEEFLDDFNCKQSDGFPSRIRNDWTGLINRGRRPSGAGNAASGETTQNRSSSPFHQQGVQNISEKNKMILIGDFLKSMQLPWLTGYQAPPPAGVRLPKCFGLNFSELKSFFPDIHFSVFVPNSQFDSISSADFFSYETIPLIPSALPIRSAVLLLRPPSKRSFNYLPINSSQNSAGSPSKPTTKRRSTVLNSFLYLMDHEPTPYEISYNQISSEMNAQINDSTENTAKLPIAFTDARNNTSNSSTLVCRMDFLIPEATPSSAVDGITSVKSTRKDQTNQFQINKVPNSVGCCASGCRSCFNNTCWNNQKVVKRSNIYALTTKTAIDGHIDDNGNLQNSSASKEIRQCGGCCGCGRCCTGGCVCGCCGCCAGGHQLILGEPPCLRPQRMLRCPKSMRKYSQGFTSFVFTKDERATVRVLLPQGIFPYFVLMEGTSQNAALRILWKNSGTVPTFDGQQATGQSKSGGTKKEKQQTTSSLATVESGLGSKYTTTDRRCGSVATMLTTEDYLRYYLDFTVEELQFAVPRNICISRNLWMLCIVNVTFCLPRSSAENYTNCTSNNGISAKKPPAFHKNYIPSLLLLPNIPHADICPFLKLSITCLNDEAAQATKENVAHVSKRQGQDHTDNEPPLAKGRAVAKEQTRTHPQIQRIPDEEAEIFLDSSKYVQLPLLPLIRVPIVGNMLCPLTAHLTASKNGRITRRMLVILEAIERTPTRPVTFSLSFAAPSLQSNKNGVISASGAATTAYKASTHHLTNGQTGTGDNELDKLLPAPTLSVTPMAIQFRSAWEGSPLMLQGTSLVVCRERIKCRDSAPVFAMITFTFKQKNYEKLTAEIIRLYSANSAISSPPQQNDNESFINPPLFLPSNSLSETDTKNLDTSNSFPFGEVVLRVEGSKRLAMPCCEIQPGALYVLCVSVNDEPSYGCKNQMKSISSSEILGGRYVEFLAEHNNTWEFVNSSSASNEYNVILSSIKKGPGKFESFGTEGSTEVPAQWRIEICATGDLVIGQDTTRDDLENAFLEKCEQFEQGRTEKALSSRTEFVKAYSDSELNDYRKDSDRCADCTGEVKDCKIFCRSKDDESITQKSFEIASAERGHKISYIVDEIMGNQKPLYYGPLFPSLSIATFKQIIYWQLQMTEDEFFNNCACQISSESQPDTGVTGKYFLDGEGTSLRLTSETFANSKAILTLGWGNEALTKFFSEELDPQPPGIISPTNGSLTGGITLEKFRQMLGVAGSRVTDDEGNGYRAGNRKQFDRKCVTNKQLEKDKQIAKGLVAPSTKHSGMRGNATKDRAISLSVNRDDILMKDLTFLNIINARFNAPMRPMDYINRKLRIFVQQASGNNKFRYREIHYPMIEPRACYTKQPYMYKRTILDHERAVLDLKQRAADKEWELLWNYTSAEGSSAAAKWMEQTGCLLSEYEAFKQEVLVSDGSACVTKPVSGLEVSRQTNTDSHEDIWDELATQRKQLRQQQLRRLAAIRAATDFFDEEGSVKDIKRDDVAALYAEATSAAVYLFEIDLESRLRNQLALMDTVQKVQDILDKNVTSRKDDLQRRVGSKKRGERDGQSISVAANLAEIANQKQSGVLNTITASTADICTFLEYIDTLFESKLTARPVYKGKMQMTVDTARDIIGMSPQISLTKSKTKP